MRKHADYYVLISTNCSGCGSRNKMVASKTLFICSFCGLAVDRDLNAAKNIEQEGLQILNGKVPMEKVTRRELTPADTSANTPTELVKYFNNIPRVRASIVDETGSLATVVTPQMRRTSGSRR